MYLIRKAKQEYYVEAIAANKKNPTVLWKHMKGLYPDKQRTIPNVLQVDEEIITDAEEIANVFNSYFANVPNNYVPEKKTNLDPDNVTKISNFVNPKLTEDCEFQIPVITTDFILKHLKSMANSKATGLDGFSVKILKMSAPAIVASITKICNLSIQTGIFPDKWKEARVTPIYKKGNREACCNYRPVSVLPILSKIIEKHIFKYLYTFLNTNKLLTDTQFGFRKQHSCQTALLAITEKMYQAIFDGKYFGMIQLDLSKAFDLVNHSLLLQKLQLYKCDVASLKWFRSYLDNRSQKVNIKHKLSTSKQIGSGVPQGSILGPLLFLLYINDMPLYIDTSEDLLYADDTTLSTSSFQIPEIERILSNDVKNVMYWCNNNDMALSVPKSSSMIVTTKQKLSRNRENISINVEIDSASIPCVSSTKILGVYCDNVLSWEEHIRHIHNKIVRNLYLLQQIKAYLPTDARKMFVNNYVMPHFDYCCIIWGNCSQTLLYDLEKLQKRAARLILDEALDRENTTRSSILFSKLNWMSLQDRIKFHRAVQVFKCVNKLSGQVMENLFDQSKNVHDHNTRAAQNNNLYIAQQHFKSFSFIGATTWNSIPVQIRDAKSLESFKRQYVKHLNNNLPSEIVT